jgi:hypothetical protein
MGVSIRSSGVSQLIRAKVVRSLWGKWGQVSLGYRCDLHYMPNADRVSCQRTTRCGVLLEGERGRYLLSVCIALNNISEKHITIIIPAY